jgi:N5-(carboxyethyl)ornithine synthase
MLSIGFVISKKKNEKRRALLPNDLKRIRNKKQLYFSEDYGNVLGIPDEAYLALGANIVSEDEAYSMDVICNPKAPELSEQVYFKTGQTLFGWIHAVQGRSVTDFLIGRNMTAIAWEDMYEDGLHSFWLNNEIAGEAAIIHSVPHLGRLPNGLHSCIIGKGNCSRGAYKMLSKLGADIIVYDRHTVKRLRDEIGQYDIVVNAVLWDVFRKDHIIYKEDLVKMKTGSMIVDISCDPGMGIETSRPTTIEDPIYEIDGIKHYAVDHAPTIFHSSASSAISSVVSRYIDSIVEEEVNPVLNKAIIIKHGTIIDERIKRYQRR